MSKKQRDKFTALWKIEVFDHSTEVDPGGEQDWYSITLGWAIGNGISFGDAHEFASYIRYETELG